MNGALTLYTVYGSPKDYVGKYVVRRWHVSCGKATPALEPDAVTDTLEEASEALPSGLTRIDRAKLDDECVVESWL